MTLPGTASIPAVDSAHDRMAAASGRRIVDMAWEDLTPDKILTRGGVRGRGGHRARARRLHQRVIHLIAMAGRAGVDLTLDDFDAIVAHACRCWPTSGPSGKYLMEDFYFAGGLPALLGQLAKVPGALHPDRLTVTGTPVAANRSPSVPVHNPDVIRAPGHRAGRRGRGGGAARQPGPGRRGHQAHRRRAAAAQAHRPRGRLRRLRRRCSARINDPALGITADTVLVLRNAGPQGRPRHARVRHAAHPRPPARSRACATWCGSPTPG